ncbi:hypothetical protein HDU96_009849 [Phlyctochytrium bullatum]|nr:hypothetical protein HDU96_009849 [Phlyctochytrium bullatum]
MFVASGRVPCTLQRCTASFSTTAHTLSRVGQKAIRIPDGVSIQVLPLEKPPTFNTRINQQVLVKGPLGQLSMPIYPFIKIDEPNVAGLTTEDGEPILPKLFVKVDNPKDRDQKTMWGTTRSLINNMVEGVSEGYTVPVHLVGVGYRATLEAPPKPLPGQLPGRPKLSLKLGFSHPVEFQVPEGIELKVPVPQRIIIQGIDLYAITQFAAKIRAWRPPEPYNQKGVFVGGETIKKKVSFTI